MDVMGEKSGLLNCDASGMLTNRNKQQSTQRSNTQTIIVQHSTGRTDNLSSTTMKATSSTPPPPPAATTTSMSTTAKMNSAIILITATTIGTTMHINDKQNDAQLHDGLRNLLSLEVAVPILATFYMYGAVQTLRSSALTLEWFQSIATCFLASLAISYQLEPLMESRLDDRMSEPLWPILCAVHLFNSLTPLSMVSILRPALRDLKKGNDATAATKETNDHDNAQKTKQSAIWTGRDQTLSDIFWAIGAIITIIGNFAEIVGHEFDGWVYLPKSESSSGWTNFVFCLGLCGGMSGLAAAITPTNTKKVMLAFLPTVLVALVPFILGWNQSVKPIVFSCQGLASGLGAHAVGSAFGSHWPWLYFVQSFNIVRNASRIQSTGIQALHLMTSCFGFFSYTVPFVLSVNKKTKSTPLWIVLLVSAASVYLGGALENYIASTEWGQSTGIY